MKNITFLLFYSGIDYIFVEIITFSILALILFHFKYIFRKVFYQYFSNN